MVCDVSFGKCEALRELTLVKKSMGHPNNYLTGIMSSITSEHIQRITMGFVEQISDSDLRKVIKYKAWEKFDEAVARLAERALNNGRRLEFELHVCGNPTAQLFDQVFPRFAENGCLGVVRTSFIWKGPILSILFV